MCTRHPSATPATWSSASLTLASIITKRHRRICRSVEKAVMCWCCLPKNIKISPCLLKLQLAKVGTFSETKSKCSSTVVVCNSSMTSCIYSSVASRLICCVFRNISHGEVLVAKTNLKLLLENHQLRYLRNILGLWLPVSVRYHLYPSLISFSKYNQTFVQSDFRRFWHFDLAAQQPARY